MAANDDPKLVAIDIDGDEFKEPKGKITYDRVVELAYPDFAQFPNATYSIVYERGHADKPQGTLTGVARAPLAASRSPICSV